MGSLHRFYVDTPLSAGSTIDLPEGCARQIGAVLRLRAGDRLVLFNGDGLEYHAVLEQIGKSRARVSIQDSRPGRPLPKPGILLAQGLLKADRFDWVVQKATELGVRRILPLVTSRTVVTLAADRAAQRRERWRRIAIEAAEQSGRTGVPVIDDPADLSSILAATRGTPAILFWEEERETPLPLALPEAANQVLLIVGPEGGLTEDEVRIAVEAGARVASLGPLTLRSETAAIAGIAGLQALAAAIDCGVARGRRVGAAS